MTNAQNSGYENITAHSTHQLHPCKVPFPPQIGAHSWPHGRQTIVSIHEDVNEAVECGTKVGSSSRDPLAHQPPQEAHGGVVIYMKQGNLIVLLSQDEKELQWWKYSNILACMTWIVNLFETCKSIMTMNNIAMIAFTFSHPLLLQLFDFSRSKFTMSLQSDRSSITVCR